VPLTSIHEILAELRSSSTDERDKGDKFERLMAAYLRTDPLYADRYTNVWLWSDWPGREGKPDTGIDLVAEERDGGCLCAIQCKFYDPTHSLQKADLDSFFTASGKAGFTSRMVISTTDDWGKNAEEALENQQIPVTRLRVQDLDSSPVDWSQFSVAKPDQIELLPKKQLRPHQIVALEKVKASLATGDRGKLIMACGTGKTFTALRIAEDLVPAGGTALFLVPSISLISQSLKEWSSEAALPLRLFAVCSDPRVGRRTASEDIGPYDLAFPASTDPAKLIERVSASRDGHARTVIFSTYQSIGVISDAQAQGLGELDLIICDEAHRTTGVTIADEDESNFVRVHDQGFLQAKKRLYMTATPRIYDDNSKSKAAEGDAALTSMDDEAVYGPELHRLGFGEAVGAGLLSDYKVLVLAVDEEQVSRVFQSQLASADHELNLDDAAKIVGCWNGLSKRGVAADTFTTDDHPMRRAVAFSRSIKDSKRITEQFAEIVDEYATLSEDADLLRCQVEHVDGTYNALRRNEKLDWLKEDTGDDGLCRVLSNARCLSEGVDVPALDAVMFLNPRNSVVDVVQSVGRVMRKAGGKQYGYVILPIGIPSDLTPEEALKDNQKYKVVWQVLQALRAHDDRFNALVNKIELNKKANDQLQVIGVGGWGDKSEESTSAGAVKAYQGVLNLDAIEEWREAIYAKIVQKVGDRRYWEDWASNVAEIAGRHTTRIRAVLADQESEIAHRFEDFVVGLRGNLNDSITRDDAIDMLSQHLITKPVFDALFEDYSFAAHNPVSIVMQQMVDALDEHNLGKETESLDSFYESVRLRAEGIDNAEGRQRIITELYERFFKTAFPKITDSLGVVYTPIEIVDFIIHSVEAALGSEFGASLNDRGVHVLDPFTGTGTFMVRLLQSGILTPDNLARKYASELHANEIILLAYYIAAINIEATFHDLAGGEYRPFEGIVLADTFQMSEDGDPMDEVFFPQNNARVARQKETDIRVIIGNPPYSVGQGSENDDNKNMAYPTLDGKIRSTYAARTSATLKTSLYDSYIRAFRWASDRIKEQGVVCFVSNGAFIDSGSADGFRKSLADEFSAIFCFNLRGNQRTSGETSRREGGKVFGVGSRTPVAITLLVKNPGHAGPCRLLYRDIGDYLSQSQKLTIVADHGSITDVPWDALVPDESGDWINHRDPVFSSYSPLGDKQIADADPMFEIYSMGVKTNRDAWAYNFSRPGLLGAMSRTIDFYNDQTDKFGRWADAGGGSSGDVEQFIDRDPAKISWTRELKDDLRKGKPAFFLPERGVPSMYRPYCKQWLYFDRQWNNTIYQIPKLFPTPENQNLVIAVSALGTRSQFSVIITEAIPCLHLADASNGSQCFPLYHYVASEPEDTLFAATGAGGYQRRDAITDATLDRYRSRYRPDLTKDDIFYYVYGLLHSPEYRARFAADLKKMIPRIPMAADFSAFSTAGRRLADVHLGYETTDPWPLDGLPDSSAKPADLRVTKMKFPKSGKVADKSTIIFNSHVTLAGIPEEAYSYEVNGKSAIEWLMDRYEVKTDKASGIVDDPNLWSDDPRYVVDLLARIVRVSMETVEIVGGLPALGV
jgi:predicted helicase